LCRRGYVEFGLRRESWCWNVPACEHCPTSLSILSCMHMYGGLQWFMLAVMSSDYSKKHFKFCGNSYSQFTAQGGAYRLSYKG